MLYSIEPRPVFWQRTGGVGVVYHDQSVIDAGQFDDALYVGDVTVHGEHAIGGDQDIAGRDRY
ncbi:MAG: hypothetical protein IH584_00965 [Candidatus Aminicenantes bacterium]|nr:hypothetical protein [Candidatus Aminicenantes bacterium]